MLNDLSAISMLRTIEHESFGDQGGYPLVNIETTFLKDDFQEQMCHLDACFVHEEISQADEINDDDFLEQFYHLDSCIALEF